MVPLRSRRWQRLLSLGTHCPRAQTPRHPQTSFVGRQLFKRDANKINHPSWRMHSFRQQGQHMNAQPVSSEGLAVSCLSCKSKVIAAPTIPSPAPPPHPAPPPSPAKNSTTGLTPRALATLSLFSASSRTQTDVEVVPHRTPKAGISNPPASTWSNGLKPCNSCACRSGRWASQGAITDAR